MLLCQRPYMIQYSVRRIKSLPEDFLFFCFKAFDLDLAPVLDGAEADHPEFLPVEVKFRADGSRFLPAVLAAVVRKFHLRLDGNLAHTDRSRELLPVRSTRQFKHGHVLVLLVAGLGSRDDTQLRLLLEPGH